MSLKGFISVVAFGIVAAGTAAPFDMWFEARIADGRTIRIHGVGDEYAAQFEDEEGRNLVYNPQLCAYEYAARENAETFRARALERRRQSEEQLGLAKRWAALKARRRKGGGLRLMSPPNHETIGQIVGVTLLVDFPLLDDNGVETNTLANVVHPNVTASDLNDLINGTNFTKYGNESSVREYFHDASSGKLDYRNVVIGWIKAPLPREHYDDPSRECGECGRALIGDVFDALKADGRYNTEYLGLLRQATANADGEFLALNIFFAGVGSPNWDYGLWAHKWVLSSNQYDKLSVSIGGKSCHFKSYQITPVTFSPAIGTFCHESGHLICGFPDLYAYTKAGGIGNGVGVWCLMGDHSDTCPQNFCAYLRVAAGWVTPKELPSAPCQVTVTADLQDVWKFSHPTDTQQYYLIENRQMLGRDRFIPGPGILIYRCDESGSNPYGERVASNVFADYGEATNRVNYEVSVEQADGLYELEQPVVDELEQPVEKDYGNDPWFLGNTAELYANCFNSSTTPCARWSDGSPAGLNLRRFSEREIEMSFWCNLAANDDWDGARIIQGGELTLVGGTSNATVLVDEPLKQHMPATDHTLWWRWTPEEDSNVTFHTAGSLRTDGAVLDTVLGVYIRSEGAFSTIAENDDASDATRHSRVMFRATAGKTYYICVGVRGDSEMGEINLHWETGRLNDDYTDALTIAERDSFTTTSYDTWWQDAEWNTNATVQANEPLVQHEPETSHTLWWKWTAQKDCQATFKASGSKQNDGGSLDTVMGIYTYSGGTFTTVDENDDADLDNDDKTSIVTFMATAGETYYICVGGYGSSETGEIQLRWIFRPVNDESEHAVAISGASGTVMGANTNATVLTVEPLQQRYAARHTLWWKWTAPMDCTVAFDTAGSVNGYGDPLDTVLGVYTRFGNNAFATTAENDYVDSDDNDLTSRVSFTAFAGVTYYICAGVRADSSLGMVCLNWNATPANDDWGDAISISGVSGTVTGGSFNATAQEGEPLTLSMSLAYRTVWWRWTAPEDCYVTFDTTGSAHEDGSSMKTYLGVYSEYSFSPPVAQNFGINGGNDCSVAFVATKGRTYRISVSGSGDDTGYIRLNWQARPGNDNWDTAPNISFNRGNYTCTTVGMTAQADDPIVPFLEQNGKEAVNTVWWKWTAPTTDYVVFDTVGSCDSGANAIDTVIGVYYSPTSGSFSPVVQNDDLGDGGEVWSRVVFRATAGTSYYICVATAADGNGGISAPAGEIRLSWNFVAMDNLRAINNDLNDNSVGMDAPGTGNVSPQLESAAINTAWWFWTPPENDDGVTTFDTQGSWLYGDDGSPYVGGDIDTFMCVYESSDRLENGLAKVAENDNINLRRTSSVTFEAEYGKWYIFCVGRHGYEKGGRIYINRRDAQGTSEYVNLSSVTNFNTTIADGTTIYGTLGGAYKVSIADGATVTLSNAVVNGVNGAGCPWAGLTCEGDATLVLEGANSVRGFYADYPGIYVPSGSRLDIGGSGSLTASSNGRGAGIGGGSGMDCGAIYINGGAIIANGGEGASGIGAGANASSGSVTVAPELTDVTIGTTRMIAPPWDGDLSTLSTIHAVATNGTVVTGTLGVNSKVCVAPGATVTLRDATIDGVNDSNCMWAGITCLGNATIVLEGENRVIGFHHDHPGIYVPEGSTLVIRGPGSLVAKSNAFGAAGIGGGWEIPCGSIVIEGGTITAEGGWGGAFCFGGAGIGGGYKSSCGDITINGGSVNAWGGGEAAGIGGGYSNKGCGAVTIGSRVTQVVARRGVTIVDSDPYAAPIGAGSHGSDVSVTPGAGLFDVPDGDEYRTISPWNGDLSVLDAKNCDITAADGTTIYGSFSGNHRVYIAAGATVTLSNAVINGSNNSSCPWAGITCLGDATIVLEGENAVRGFYEGNPGIQVPSGSTLAITGSGSLTASSNGNAGGIGGSVTVDDGLSDTVSGTTRTFRWNGNLSKLRGDAVATNGMTIYGTLGPTASNKVSIAAGATVTLRDATIEGANSASCPWAGITCEGDATIVLEGANVVRGFHEDHPGIYVPVIRMLTIRGTGSLAASSNGKAAGIGGGNGGDLYCGDICIQGGMIVATGGVNSAGIGGGNGTDCGDISITGGDVTATGGANAAGIGAGGGGSSCHAIEVGPYITRVVATCGEGCSPVDGLTPGAVTVHDSLGNELVDRTRTISIPVWDGNLAGLVRDVTAVNGTVMTGTYTNGGYYKVSVAPGATVTLSNATIDVSDAWPYQELSWAGITCLGDATIVLEGTNFVRGFYKNYPGIHVPVGSRLVIRGAGSLEVHSHGKASGIGGGYEIPCGDIVIEGGDIEAYGGDYAAAIGGGYNSSCGNITIGPGITRVVADRGGLGFTTIGAGTDGTCGTITLDGLRDDHGTNTRTLLPPWDGNLAGLTDKDVVTARDGMVLYGTNCEGKVSIAAGATVTLSNAACRATSGFPGSGWAGLACEGDVTIVLVGDNDIQGFNSYAFGIEVPAGCTLSVQGAGSLNASGVSAGIGGGGTVVVASGLSDTGDGAMRTIRPWEWDGNLAALDRDVTAQDGMTLYGTLQGYHKVSVAAGATVTLSNAVISLAQRQDCEWAGVSCIGDARIVLADASTNTVKGCHIYYPGIHVPVGSTLAIAGRGVLNASSNGRGAGIGGGWNVSCGSIVIEGGTVNAGGGTYCAGIGGGYPYQIAVTCGSITISNGIAKVVATSSVNPIGAGLNSTCGTVTIHPDLIDDRGSPTRTLVNGGMSYDAWARRPGCGGAWDAVNTSRGTYNVFLYAFGVTPYSPAFTLLDITFDAQGRAVVKTPPLKNNVGFTFEVGASDNPDGTGNAASYALDPSGETVIDETNRTRRFFRLRATER